MNVGMLYVGNDRVAEEKAVANDAPTVRVESVRSAGRVLAECDAWIVRSRRLRPEVYRDLGQAAGRYGSRLCSPPAAYSVISGLSACAVALQHWTPPTVVRSAGSSTSELMASIDERGLRYPVFLRSEIESAAKYVGIEGCVVGQRHAPDLERAVQGLRDHVPSFEEIAVKEMWPVGTHGATGSLMEYRALGYRGSLVGFDQRSGDDLPAPDRSLEDLADAVFRSLARIGASGAHLVDIALRRDDGRPFVVEWKDLSSGSLTCARDLFRVLSGRLLLSARTDPGPQVGDALT